MPPAYLRGPDAALPATPYHLGCTGKFGFGTAGDARKAMRNLLGQTYQCTHCRWWHISKERREFRGREGGE